MGHVHHQGAGGLTMNYVASPKANLNIANKVDAFIDQTEMYLVLCYSPKRTEFKFCAFLAAWESTACLDSKASGWFDIWQKHCRKRHHGKTSLTLADPVKADPSSERLRLPKNEEVKAYAKVRGGLREVFKTTLGHYYPGIGADLSLRTGTDETAILFQKIRASFRPANSFASPEGLEVFLLTLIALFEQSLGTAEDKLISRKAWLDNIHRRRLGGSPETRTLADVAPAELRLQRQNALPEKERLEILRTMISSMRHIKKEFQYYLSKLCR
jgi:hypothetical protein